MTVATGARRVVLERATTPLLARPGHLLFARDGTIFAVPFDLRDRCPARRGPSRPACGDRRDQRDRQHDGADIGVGNARPGTRGYSAKTVLSVGRDGSALALDLPGGRYANPRVSPDGRRLLVENYGTEMSVFDFARGTLERLSPAAYGTNFGTWSADGARVMFRMFNTPVWANADGSGKTTPVPGGYVNNYPAAPGPDADSIFIVRIVEGGSGDIALVSLSGAFAAKSIVATPGYDGGPTLSPDGRWLLFVSTMSGQPEAYVKPYPALDRQWQVSAGSGTQVRWSRNGREIYYRSRQHFVAVSFTATGNEPAIGKPVNLFADTYDYGTGISIPNYDVTPDGRFILTKREAGDSGLQLGLNWTSQLERILAAGGVR